MKIIGFGHRKQVGKDTACDFLKLNMTMDNRKAIIKKVSFATPLYSICEQLYSWAGFKSRDYYNKYPNEKEIPLAFGKTPREILIGLGISCREIYNNTWVELAMQDKCDVMLISDVRFPNEAKKIKELNGIVVKIDRDIPKSNDVADIALNDYNEWDRIIKNNGTLREFDRKLKELI